MAHPNQRSLYAYGMPMLNRQHPSARGLVSLTVAQRHGAYFAPVNWTSQVGNNGQNMAVDVNTPGLNWTNATASFGMADNGMQFVGATIGRLLPNKSGTGFFPRVANNFTVAAYATFGLIDSHAVYCNIGTCNFAVKNTGAVQVWKKVSGTWRNTMTSVGGLIANGRTALVSVSCSSVDGIAVYIDGLLAHTDSTGTYVKSDIDNTDDLTAAWGQEAGGGNEYFKGRGYLLGLWSRVLNAQEQRTLALDPFALVQPSRFAAPGWARGAVIAAAGTPWLYASRPAAMIGGR